jgi:hypothetical protein
MNAHYDSEADALGIRLTEPPRMGNAEDVKVAAAAAMAAPLHFVEVEVGEEMPA